MKGNYRCYAAGDLGWAGPGQAGSRALLRTGDFLLGTVGFATADGVWSKGVTWFAFSSTDLSASSFILLWDGPKSVAWAWGSPRSTSKPSEKFCLWGCGGRASFGRFWRGDWQSLGSSSLVAFKYQGNLVCTRRQPEDSSADVVWNC